jgi:hypothetical protein
MKAQPARLPLQDGKARATSRVKANRGLPATAGRLTEILFSEEGILRKAGSREDVRGQRGAFGYPSYARRYHLRYLLR